MQREAGEPITAEWVKREGPALGFGCPRCLVVMDEREALGAGDELAPLYRQTFDDPRFNPRWQHGTAHHVEVVEIGDWTGIRTRFISQERHDLLKRLIERCIAKESATAEGCVVRSAIRRNGYPRVYLLFEDGRIFNSWWPIIYRPVPTGERGEA